MKLINVFTAALLIILPSVSSAKISSGAVGGAVAGAVVATMITSSSNKPKQTPPAQTKMKIGRSVILCRLTRDGECLHKNSVYKNVYDFAGALGYKYIYSQTAMYNCEKSVSGVCLILEVSK